MGIRLLYLILVVCLGWGTEDAVLAIPADAYSLESLNLQISEIEETLKFHADSFRSKMELADAWRQLGSMYQTKYLTHHEIGGKQRFDALALRAYDNALDHDRTNPQVVLQTSVSKGVLLKETGRGAEAISALKEAERHVQTNHDKSAVEAAKGDAYQMLGQLDEAVAAYEAALEYAPYRLNLYLPLTTAYREKRSHNKDDWLLLLDVMERAASMWQNHKNWPNAVIQDIEESWLRASRDEPLEEQMSASVSASAPSSHVYWAMYNAAHAAGDFELAWTRLEQGHRLDADHMRSNGGMASSSDAETRAQQELNAIKDLYREGFWMEGLGHTSKVPVFIVGMLRSGSTLLETMLSAHVDVVGLGEHSFFSFHQGAFGRELLQRGGQGAYDDYEGVVDDLQEVVEKHGKIVLDKIRASAAVARGAVPQGRGRVREVKRIIDKMLFNYRSIGMIHMMFPHAVIIHTMRDPMDTLYSCYTHKFDDSGAVWATEPDRLALEYAVYLEVMQHYRNVLPGRVVDVLYEELVACPEATIRQILRAIDLPWDQAVLDFQRSNRTVQTHSMQQVRQGIYTTSIGAWRRYAGGMTAIKEAFTRRLPHLKAIHALPYADRINWAGDASFDYEGSLSALVDGSTQILSSMQGGATSSRQASEVWVNGDAVGSGADRPLKLKNKTKKKGKKKKTVF